MPAATDADLVKSSEALRQAVSVLESLIDRRTSLRAELEAVNARIVDAQAAVQAARVDLRSKANSQ